MTIASPVVDATTTSNTTNTTTTKTEKDGTEAGEEIITPPLSIIEKARANNTCCDGHR